MNKEQRENKRTEGLDKKQNKIHKKSRKDNIPMERIDLKMTIALIFICCFGLLMLYSASSYECSMSKDYNYDSAYLLKKQMFFMAAGLIVIFVARYINYNLLRKCAIVIYALGNGSIFLLLTPLGISANGAKRWVDLGVMQFQIAEVVKISVIVFLAYMIYRFYGALGSWKLTLYIWAAGGIPAFLIFVISNDMSSALVILGMTFLASFICTRTWKLHLIVAAVAMVFVAFYVYGIAANLPTQEELNEMPFRVGRIAAWIAPERYAQKQGYQVLQSLYAIASGGLFGKGLGNSTQKLGAIPESQNDMIFSIICEELGLFGALILVGLFSYLLLQIVKVAIASPDVFGSVLALGVFLHIGLQSIINIAVNANWMPNTGIALPFISYGGTALFCQLFEIAMVYAVERRNRLMAAQRIRAQERMLRREEMKNQ